MTAKTGAMRIFGQAPHQQAPSTIQEDFRALAVNDFEPNPSLTPGRALAGQVGKLSGRLETTAS
jgi:hypothetical protein